MFNHWKSDTAFDLAKAPADNAYTPAGTRVHASSPEATPVSARTNPQEPSVINAWLTIRGDLEGDGEMLVKGRVHGNVRCKMLIIDTGALVEGGITAEDVIVRGAARGTIRTKRIRLEKTAAVDCEIHHDSFAAEEGARIKGTMHTNDDSTSALPAHAPKVSLKPSAQPEKAAICAPSNETPEAKVSSSLYQMLDVARSGNRSATG